MADLIRIASAELSAAINPFGAELTHLCDAQGRELMSAGDPAIWAGRAPILFPIVGGLEGGCYRLDGECFAMPRHGFARRLPWEVVETNADHARFRLTDSDATRSDYPFAFALDMLFAVEGRVLTMTATLANPGTRDLPASFGFHPAFAWPLPYGVDRADHRLTFEQAEPGAIVALNAAGLFAGTREAPLDGRTLKLRDGVFTDDALIWTPIESRSLSYGADDGPQLEIAWDAPMLGVWSKPGARFVCIEPWWGHADPAGFVGEIWDKPGIMRLAPGERRTFGMRVTLIQP